MTRAALGAIVFCAMLLTASGQFGSDWQDVQDLSLTAVMAQAPLDCTSDDGAEWSPVPDGAASMTESAWKTRALHAGLTTATGSRTLGACAPTPPPSRPASAPSYLLSIPLLI